MALPIWCAMQRQTCELRTLDGSKSCKTSLGVIWPSGLLSPWYLRTNVSSALDWQKILNRKITINEAGFLSHGAGAAARWPFQAGELRTV
jgi:hypothetical protein